MENPEILKREVKALVFDQYGTIVDMQGGLVAAVTPFLAQKGWAGRPENIVIGHGIFLVTLPLVMISLGLESIERAFLEAAETMGADARTSFLTIVLPLAMRNERLRGIHILPSRGQNTESLLKKHRD